jgi:hypothetical protein
MQKIDNAHKRDNVQLYPAHNQQPFLPILGVITLAFVTACSGSRVPVRSGVAALHAEEHPECEDLAVSSSPMGVSNIARVQIIACGTRTDYICTTDSLPNGEDLIDHTRARCAPSDSLRGGAMRTLERHLEPSQSVQNSQQRIIPVRSPRESYSSR